MSLTKITLQLALPLAISLALTGCGGASSGNSTNEVGFGSHTETDTTDENTTTTDDNSTDDASENETTTAPKVVSLIVYSSSRTLSSDADANDATEGSEPVLIYMMAKDKNNIALSGVTFTPSVDNGATLFPGSVSADGILTTWKLVPDEPRNQTIKVDITAGDITETLNIDVVGTNLQIDGPASIPMDTATTYTVKLKDTNGKGLAQQSVAVNVESKNITPTKQILNTALSTDSEGEIQFDIQSDIGDDYIINVESLGASSNKVVNVSPNTFNLNSTLEEVPVGRKQTITLSWTSGGIPQNGKIIHISATRGAITGTTNGQIITDANGNASFEIESFTAGGTVITATDNSTYLSTSLAFEYVATVPHYLNIQADPSLIAALGTSTILAQVNDISDNPVKNQVVIFNLNDTVDGKLSSSKATTNSSGQASVVYTAGKAISAKDGVKITSYIEGKSTVPADKTFLTVGGDAVRIAFGFDEKISENGVFYEKEFGVIVTDNAGNPVSNKKIDFSVTSIGYAKGYLGWDGEKWGYDVYHDCSEYVEDKDKDGWLDDGEDYNNSGKLEPTNSTTITGNSTTNEAGQATVKISYLQNFAWWETVQITAQVFVSGTEYKSKIDQNLHALNADVTAEGDPPNKISPYGVKSCLDPD